MNRAKYYIIDYTNGNSGLYKASSIKQVQILEDFVKGLYDFEGITEITEEASNLYIASGETITDLRSKLEKRKRSK